MHHILDPYHVIDNTRDHQAHYFQSLIFSYRGRGSLPTASCDVPEHPQEVVWGLRIHRAAKLPLRHLLARRGSSLLWSGMPWCVMNEG